MAETIGIISTLFVIRYYSKKQMQSLSVDLETKILNDLEDKIMIIRQNDRKSKFNKGSK